MFQKVKKNTNTAKRLTWSYDHARGATIYDLYKSPSYRKVRACESLVELMKEMKGYGFRVTGGNSSFFSCAFIYEEEGKKKLAYFTGRNDYSIDLE